MFIAGEIAIGLGVARQIVESKSSAIPARILAIIFAVAGAIKILLIQYDSSPLLHWDQAKYVTQGFLKRLAWLTVL